MNEGISNTLLEAMATGLSVIATDVGGNPELVLDGETGTLIPPDDVGAIARAIKLYVSDTGLMSSHGRAGRERVLRMFSLQAMVDSYADLYDRMLSRISPTRIN